MTKLTINLALGLTCCAVVFASLACGGGKSAEQDCRKYRDHVIDMRLGRVSTPKLQGDRVAVELRKHRALMIEHDGEKLLEECRTKSAEQIECAMTAKDVRGARACVGYTAAQRTSTARSNVSPDVRRGKTGGNR